ncbi:iron chaperone [Phenylobacterium sp. VNQ135]|uniref:iron chaperone n=1 Tax=Phenylobacterium sp. VNQ135 TaxID=3400922 RepID=UPI003C0CBDAE
MVQSQAATVDAYLAEVSPAREPQLIRLREIARRVLADHHERMLWGRPTYLRHGRAIFGFAEQKQYVSLYFGDHELLDDHGESLSRVRRSKGCLRYRKSAPIDWAVIERLLAEAALREPT